MSDHLDVKRVKAVKPLTKSRAASIDKAFDKAMKVAAKGTVSGKLTSTTPARNTSPPGGGKIMRPGGAGGGLVRNKLKGQF